MHVFTRWDEELPPEVDHEIFSTIALWYIEGISDDGVRERCSQFITEGRIKDFVSEDIPYDRLTCEDAARLRQGLALYSKREDLDLGFDKMATALRKFDHAENLCKETNGIFRSRAKGEFQFSPRVEVILWHATRKIRSILGDVPAISELRFKFGPGATTQIPKRKASARAKLGHKPACSSELFPAARQVLEEMPTWLLSLREQFPGEETPVTVSAGKVSFVPKSAKEYRTIMVEPTLNTLVQAGIGSFMAERLRRCGVDIRDQSRNQSLARKGSLTGDLSTVDLSSASDTIATELVYDLLGIDWARFLDRARTSNVLYKGNLVRLEKFSSMGNGFTFPLETLIFYALAWAVCVYECLPTSEVSAYGDDIILPVGATERLYEVFRALGFIVNVEKSYSSGPFRESCGADYYQGADIRPVYQKTRPCIFDLFRLHNFFHRKCEFEVCEYILSFITEPLRLYGPDGYGDGHLLGEWVPVRKKRHASSGYGGYTFDTYTLRSRRSFQSYAGDRVLPAYSIYVTEGCLDRTELRGCDVQYGRDGGFSVVIPGASGVKRMSIYTLRR